jgi:hypothetical protein
LENLKRRNDLGNLGIDGKIIFRIGLVNTIMKLRVPQRAGNLLDQLSNDPLLRKGTLLLSC